MIYRYFIELSYDGTRYVGWQIQPNGMSIQEKIEHCLSIKRNEKISLTGAGRTDTGVHARFYVAHFDVSTPILQSNDFIYSLNSFLPEDIAVSAIYPVHPEAHARFSAFSRSYEYQISLAKNPFVNPYAWYVRHPLAHEQMQEAASRLMNHTDFTSFSKLHTDVKTNDCTITRAEFTRDGDRLLFTIEANRFLRNMVRAIVGTLVEVGKGRISPDEFESIIISKNRALAASSAPAQGLFLTEVKYPSWVFVPDVSDKSS